jgi:signal transduction histidine kinase
VIEGILVAAMVRGIERRSFSMTTDIVEDLGIEGLVHDLNNVFESISDAADLMESDPKWKRLAGAIHRSVQRGQRIVGSYSAGTRDQQGLDAILDSAIESAQDLFQAADAPAISFTRSIQPGIRISGSAAAWERVLFNLFINAAQAMEHGGSIDVRAICANGLTGIWVTDTGPGIPLEILPQIFDPHFSTKSSNSGLGLSIVKSLVTQNGGSVTAHNRPGIAGAVFHIQLPAE